MPSLNEQDVDTGIVKTLLSLLDEIAASFDLSIEAKGLALMMLQNPIALNDKYIDEDKLGLLIDELSLTGFFLRITLFLKNQGGWVQFTSTAKSNMEEKLKKVLLHWKEARGSGKLSRNEVEENLRCAVDIGELLGESLTKEERKSLLKDNV